MWYKDEREGTDRGMKLVYGLGNPGKRYALTRHNAGFMAVDVLCRRLKVSLKKTASGILYERARIKGVEVMLAKPMTYMNLSGEPFRTFRIDPQDLVVVHDDMDIPKGVVRVKVGGGTGGHKGLDSLCTVLGSGDFVRVRLGIGRPPEGMDPSEFVLSPLDEAEKEAFEEQLEQAADAVIMCVTGETTRAMNTFNRRSEQRMDGPG